MPDELAALLAGAASADADGTAPATPAAKPEGIETQKASNDWEDRFKGLQRTVAEKDRALAELQRQVEEVRLSSMSEEDRAMFAQKREADELAALRAENELLKLAANPKYASVYEPFARLLNARNAEEQLEYMAQLLAPKSQTEEPATPEPPPVDTNNPRRTAAITLPDGTEMTDELAKMILDRASRFR